MNVEIACPQCGTSYAVRRELLGKRSKCVKCGTAFVIAETTGNPMPSVPLAMPEVALPEFTPVPQIAVRPRTTTDDRPQESFKAEGKPAAPSYWALRLIARSYEVFAIISAVSCLVPLVLLIHAAVQWPNLIVITLVRYGLPIIILLLSAVMYLFLAQVIRLMLQLEQNTRESADACRRLAEHLCAVEGED
jgi:predicted Zn finger-like uncharacterized protein